MKNLKLVFYLTMFLVVLFSISIVNAAKDEYPTLNTPVKVDISGALPEFNRYELEQIIDSWVDEKFSESEAQKIKSEILNEDGIDAIMELQDNYKISPIFTLAVATTESYDRGSVNTSIFKEGKNLFNIIGEYNSNYVVYANKHYKKYDTYRESFFDFGRTIAESPYYFNANKTTIKQIGEVYYGNEKWTESVVKNSKEILSYFKERIYKYDVDIDKNTSVEKIAKECISYLNEYNDFFKDDVSSNTIPPYNEVSKQTWGEPKAQGMDSSLYVSWVIYEYAKARNYSDLLNEFKDNFTLDEFEKLGEELEDGNSDGYRKYFKLIATSEDIPNGEIKNIKNELKAGDILFYADGETNNVEILCSTDETNVYSCESKLGWQNPGKQSYTRRNDITYIFRLVDANDKETCSHKYNYEITKEATCTEEGTRVGTCTKCGNVVKETIEKLEHEFSYDYEYDNEYHYDTCDICGEEISQKHKFKNNKCTICGYEKEIEKENENEKDNEKEVEKEKKVEDIFNDIDKKDWYHDATQYVIDKNIFNGMSDNEFGPNIEITRGMLVTVLYRLSGSKTSKLSTFDDVNKNSYYSNAIYWAEENKIVNGVGDNKFAPDREITREDLATILVRYINYKKLKFSDDKKAEGSFNDYNEISNYAQENVTYMKKKGLMQGKNGNNFDPKGKATRAEVATLLMRLDK